MTTKIKQEVLNKHTHTDSIVTLEQKHCGSIQGTLTA